MPHTPARHSLYLACAPLRPCLGAAAPRTIAPEATGLQRQNVRRGDRRASHRLLGSCSQEWVQERHAGEAHCKQGAPGASRTSCTSSEGPRPPGHTLGTAVASALLDPGSYRVQQLKGYCCRAGSSSPGLLCGLLASPHSSQGPSRWTSGASFQRANRGAGGPQSGIKEPGPECVFTADTGHRGGKAGPGAQRRQGERPPACLILGSPQPASWGPDAPPTPGVLACTPDHRHL